MLIIFDLDDTLIDTTESFTPLLIKKAFDRMIANGLILQNKNAAYLELIRLSSVAQSSKIALAEFLEIHDQIHLLQIGIDAIYHNPCFAHGIKAYEDTLEILEFLSQNHQLALVTRGEDIIQRKKLALSQIPENWFSHIIVTKEPSKKVCYQKIMLDLNFSPNLTLVCGDRISYDLTPAKELGAITVHIRTGRGLGNTGLKTDVDYTILSIGELKNIVHSIETLTPK